MTKSTEYRKGWADAALWLKRAGTLPPEPQGALPEVKTEEASVKKPAPRKAKAGD